jgi:hypothetical protein
MGATIRFTNPYNSDFDVIEIGVDLTLGIKIELLYDFTIGGKVETLKMKTQSLKTYFQTNVNVKELDTKISAMEPALVSAINLALLRGKSMKVRKFVKRDYSETEMFIYDHYLMIEMRP